MKIRDITLIYSSDSAQRDGIARAGRRFDVKAWEGLRFMEPDDPMEVAIRQVQSGNANVTMTNLRVIYVLDTPASAQAFGQVMEQLMRIYNKGLGLYTGCSCQILWKTDGMRMSECYARIAEYVDRLRENDVATKLMLVSQRNDAANILRGIDTETVSTLAVLSACGKLNATYKGVFVYETKQLSILPEDIDNILESEILRQLDRLPGRAYADDQGSADAQQYRQDLWKLFFSAWSGNGNDLAGNGNRLTDIKIDDRVRRLLPAETDFCVFAPRDYGEIHRALDFFDDENSKRLLERLPDLLANSWTAHAMSVLAKAPDLYNADVQAFFHDLSEQQIQETGGNSGNPIPSEPEGPRIFGKEKFYMGQLAEQARARLNRYSTDVRAAFLKALKEACKELAEVVIPAEINWRYRLIDDFKAGLIDAHHRYVRQEELERYRTYNKTIVDDICNRVQSSIDRRFIRNYPSADKLIFDGNAQNALDAWHGFVQACKNTVLRLLNIRDLIQQINMMPLQDVSDRHIKTNGRLMFTGRQVSTHQTDGFCVMSSAIALDRRSIIADACGVQRDAFELLDKYDNVSAVLEYQLLAQTGEADSDAIAQPEKVLPQISVWDLDPITDDNLFERSRGPEAPVAEAGDTRERAEASPDSPSWPGIRDDGNNWIMQSEDWDGHKPQATIMVSIRALDDDGISPVNRNMTFLVGKGGSSQLVIPKAGFYGTCHVSMSRNATDLGTKELQGLRISCLYELHDLRKSVSIGRRDDGERLSCYRVTLRDEAGQDRVPLLQNGEPLAVSYASGDTDEWKAAMECVFYVSRGSKKANELEVFIPSGREDSFRLVPAQHRDLYQLVRE